MQRRIALTLTAAVLLVAETAWSEERAPAPLPPPLDAAAAERQVDLDYSFRIPQSEGAGISHTPAVVFTMDGERMVTATSEGRLAVFDVATRRLLREIATPAKATDGVAIDPHGRFAVWSLQEQGVVVLDIATGKEIARDPDLAARWVAVSPDASHVVVTKGERIEIREIATLARAGETISASAEVTNVIWSADGARLAWTTAGGHVVVRDLARASNVFEAKKDVGMHALAFAPDGRRFAFGGQDNQVYQYTFATESEAVISKGQPFWITCLGYSPDGQHLAVGDESCDIWLYDVEPAKLTFHNKHHVECWLSSVAWSPDNETFLFGCRPNSHAGRPSLHTPLTLAEAARSDAARHTRSSLLVALDAEIARAKDATRRSALETYRASVAAEEQVQAGVGYGLGDFTEALQTGTWDTGAPAAASAVMTIGGGGGAGGDFTAGTTEAIGLAAPPPPDLPDAVRRLLDAHRRTLQDEVKKLQGDFCVEPVEGALNAS